MKKGFFAFFLHSHIPYMLNHGTWPHGTDWLHEANAECYIPMMSELEKLSAQGIAYSITVSFSPILIEQVSDKRFQGEFRQYLKERASAAKADEEEFSRAGRKEMARLAAAWRNFYQAEREEKSSAWEKLLILNEKGSVEIATAPFTHPYLPLIGDDRSITLQVSAGKKTFHHYGGKELRGMWLPECGYRPRGLWRPPAELAERHELERPGIDEFLKGEGIQYFIVDHHLTAGGRPLGTYMERFPILERLFREAELRQPYEERRLSPYQSHRAPSGTCFFTRDPKTTVQVWSRIYGYPGTAEYLEFHKKHYPGGLRYWQVTHPESDLAMKEMYKPEAASQRIKEQAAHFVSLVEGIVGSQAGKGMPPPIVVAPYDTELFGHWWFEGPSWLAEVLRLMASSSVVESINLGDYLDAYAPDDFVSLPEGSWGEGGFHWVWLNADTQWIWKEIYKAEEAFWSLDPGQSSPYLEQALRELVLLESSDWPFLITTLSAADYGENRAAFHASNLHSLLEMHHRSLEGRCGTEDEAFLRDLRKRDGVMSFMRGTSKILSPEKRMV